jgi:hypothetical protein
LEKKNDGCDGETQSEEFQFDIRAIIYGPEVFNFQSLRGKR